MGKTRDLFKEIRESKAKIYDLMDRMGYLTPDEHDPKKKKVNVTYEELEKLREEAEKEDEE